MTLPVTMQPPTPPAGSNPDAGARYAAAVRRLESLAFDGESENVRCLMGGPCARADQYRLVIGDLEAFLAAVPGFGWAHALKGKTLLNLGDIAGAAMSFDAALRAEPGLATAYLWRAQGELMRGRHAQAASDLKRFTALTGGSGWSLFLNGLCRMAAGDGTGARGDWNRSLRWSPGSTATRSMIALSLAENGKPEEAVRRLTQIAREPGRAPAYVLALKGLVERQLGDLDGSRASLDRALSREQAPWIYSHRADVLNRMGSYQMALADLRTLSELAPESPDAEIQAANILFDQGFYDQALTSVEAAQAKRPGDPSLQLRRARLLWAAGRQDEAAAALRETTGAPQNPFERIQLLLLCGELDQAERELSSKEFRKGAYGELMRGVLSCRRKDWPTAAKHFFAAKKAAKPGDPLHERASFYGTVARLLSLPPSLGKEVARPSLDPQLDHSASGSSEGRRVDGCLGLNLCSVGIRHPYQVTVEVLHVLNSCDVIFTNLPDPNAWEFLSLFPGRLVTVPRPSAETASDGPRAGWILDRVMAGQRAGFVTRIHPFMYRRIGLELVEQSRKRGLPFRAYGAPSLTELAVGLASVDGAGLDVFDIGELDRTPARLRTERATVIYCIGSGPDRPRLVKELRRRYPPKHQAYLLGGSGDRELEGTWVPLKGLEAVLEKADLGCVLYVPPAKGKKHG